MRNQAVGVCLGEMVALLWYPVEVAFTGNGPAGTSCEPPPFFRNPKVWSTAITVRSKNTAIGWIFNQLLGRTFSGPTEGIFRILPPRSGIQVHIQYVTMPESKFYIQTWASWISATGQIAIEKWPSSKHFQTVCDCQHTEFWESCVTLRRKRHQQRVCFPTSI